MLPKCLGLKMFVGPRESSRIPAKFPARFPCKKARKLHRQLLRERREKELLIGSSDFVLLLLLLHDNLLEIVWKEVISERKAHSLQDYLEIDSGAKFQQ